MSHRLDARSQGVRSGNVRLTSTGQLDHRCSAARSGAAFSRADGHVDQRSSVVRSGNVTLAPSSSQTQHHGWTPGQVQRVVVHSTRPIRGLAPTYREDTYGNIISSGQHGSYGPRGFEIDHSRPLDTRRGAPYGTDHPNNLHAIQTHENRLKSSSRNYEPAASPKGVSSLEFPFDRRSSAVQTGEVFATLDGRVDPRCAAVRSGDLRVTDAGDVDGRSSIVRDGRLIP